MKERSLERKVQVVSDGFSEARYPMELEYYLLESVIDDGAELEGKKAYGVEVVKKETRDENFDKIERKIIANLSCCKEETRDIINKLADNTVTPVSLEYILDDMIGT